MKFARIFESISKLFPDIPEPCIPTEHSGQYIYDDIAVVKEASASFPASSSLYGLMAGSKAVINLGHEVQVRLS